MLEGSVVRPSKKCAEIIFYRPVSVMTNLKMNLGDVDEKLSAKDFQLVIMGLPFFLMFLLLYWQQSIFKYSQCNRNQIYFLRLKATIRKYKRSHF